MILKKSLLVCLVALAATGCNESVDVEVVPGGDGSTTSCSYHIDNLSILGGLIPGKDSYIDLNVSSKGLCSGNFEKSVKWVIDSNHDGIAGNDGDRIVSGDSVVIKKTEDGSAVHVYVNVAGDSKDEFFKRSDATAVYKTMPTYDGFSTLIVKKADGSLSECKTHNDGVSADNACVRLLGVTDSGDGEHRKLIFADTLVSSKGGSESTLYSSGVTFRDKSLAFIIDRDGGEENIISFLKNKDGNNFDLRSILVANGYTGLVRNIVYVGTPSGVYDGHGDMRVVVVMEDGGAIYVDANSTELVVKPINSIGGNVKSIVAEDGYGLLRGDEPMRPLLAISSDGVVSDISGITWGENIFSDNLESTLSRVASDDTEVITGRCSSTKIAAVCTLLAANGRSYSLTSDANRDTEGRLELEPLADRMQSAGVNEILVDPLGVAYVVRDDSFFRIPARDLISVSVNNLADGRDRLDYQGAFLRLIDTAVTEYPLFQMKSGALNVSKFPEGGVGYIKEKVLSVKAPVDSNSEPTFLAGKINFGLFDGAVSGDITDQSITYSKFDGSIPSSETIKKTTTGELVASLVRLPKPAATSKPLIVIASEQSIFAKVVGINGDNYYKLLSSAIDVPSVSLGDSAVSKL